VPKILVEPSLYLFLSTLSNLTFLAFASLLFSTARRRNGFAGIHDLISNTRVVALLRTEDESVDFSAETLFIPEPKQHIGPYVALDSLRKSARDELLLGYDIKLRRKIWINVLPAGAPALSDTRRDVARRGRLRWINGKRTPELSWDAYEAVEGSPFLQYLKKQNPWIQVRRWLLEIIDEISAGLRDRSMPSSLGLDQVWITSKGQVKMLDFGAPGLDPGSAIPERIDSPEDSRSIRVFLKQVILSALEGDPKCINDIRGGVPGIPLPLQARSFIQILDAENSLSMEELAGLLKSMIDKQEITSSFRRKRLGTILPFISMMFLAIIFQSTNQSDSTGTLIGWAISLGYVGVLASLSAFVFKGGLFLRNQGITIVNRDGSPASRLRALSRSLVGCSPMIIMALLPSFWNKTWLLFPSNVGNPLDVGKLGNLSFPSWLPVCCLAASILGSVWSVITPERSPHDRIVGTYLVPR